MFAAARKLAALTAVLAIAAGCGGQAAPEAPLEAAAGSATTARPAIEPLDPDDANQEPAPRPATENAPSEPRTQPQPEPAAQPEPEPAVPPEPEPATQPEPAAVSESGDDSGASAGPGECAEGEVFLEDHAGGDDDGCRPERCELGRIYSGWCQEPLHFMETTTTVPLPSGGAPCPPPAVSADAGFTGRGSVSLDDSPVVTLTDAVWRFEACVRNNGAPDGALFRVSIHTMYDGGRSGYGWVINEWRVIDGDWSIDLPNSDEPRPTRVMVEAEGDGVWVVTITGLP